MAGAGGSAGAAGSGGGLNTTLYVGFDYSARQVLVWDEAEDIHGPYPADRTLSYPAEGQLSDVVLDPTRDLLYVSNWTNAFVTVLDHASLADGSTSPNRKIVSTGGMSEAYSIALDPDRDTLYVATYASMSVQVFENASTLDGTVAPTRTLFGTSVTHPMGINLDVDNDRLYLVNADPNSGASHISVFNDASTAGGDVAANRQITGETSGLWGWAEDVWVDASRDMLYVASGYTVARYENASSLTGNVTPNGRTLVSANSIYLDEESDRLFLSCSSGSSPGAFVCIIDNASTMGTGTDCDRKITGLTGPSGLWGLSQLP